MRGAGQVLGETLLNCQEGLLWLTTGDAMRIEQSWSIPGEDFFSD